MDFSFVRLKQIVFIGFLRSLLHDRRVCRWICPVGANWLSCLAFLLSLSTDFLTSVSLGFVCQHMTVYHLPPVEIRASHGGLRHIIWCKTHSWSTTIYERFLIGLDASSYHLSQDQEKLSRFPLVRWSGMRSATGHMTGQGKIYNDFRRTRQDVPLVIYTRWILMRLVFIRLGSEIVVVYFADEINSPVV